MGLIIWFFKQCLAFPVCISLYSTSPVKLICQSPPTVLQIWWCEQLLYLFNIKSLSSKMFKQHVKEVLREADPNKSLIYHGGPEKVDLLALVKKKKNLLFSAKYDVQSTTFVHLIPGLSVDVTEEDFIKDYQSSGQISVSGSIQGGLDKVSADVKAGGSSQQGSSTVTIKMKAVDRPSLKKGYRGQKIDTFWMPELEKGEVLGFVDRIIYNADEVELHGQTEVDGESKASWSVFFGFSAKGKMEKEKSYKVPAGRVYAYGFNEIKFQDDEIKSVRVEMCSLGVKSCGIEKVQSYSDKILAPETFEADNVTENTYENLQQIQEELQKIEGVFQPLSHLPRATRSTLFQRLCWVSEEKDAVTALEQALSLWCEQQRFHLPQSLSACSVLDLLRLAPLTRWTYRSCFLRAVHMLVSAVDILPDHMPAMITKCSPDTLTVLNHLVSSIRDSGKAQVAQPLPGPLQEGGELHWLTEFLCSTDETLQDLDELAMVAGETPGALLLALCITVQGLHMMQGEQNES
ncbi:uncharacterized protein LOC115437283 isoform X2 [Sphaeramia orbicularis]|uniref:uncharacterized protein LOC115437283 isoform X2 n=1 Tax=Sphaeramia orbicularis TaxID=375764 RepID=UPI00117FA0F2|nr:uncharacterized protein LOC115437283 isoform X2 [Sphaeramia orbicularis]